MIFIYVYAVLMASINLGNSLQITRNQCPSEERYNFFDAELFQAFSRKETGNMIISPVGIKLILGMLAEGATDQTATEIRTALRLSEDAEARRKQFSTWLMALQSKNPENIVKVAHRIFLSDCYPVNLTYRKILRKYYSAGVTSINFKEEKAASHAINMWVGNHTSQLIPSLVREGEIPPDTKLILASAVYFKGLWMNPFLSERTATRCFYSPGDKCNESLMMTETGYFDYAYISRLDAKAIVLPYKGEKFSMLLLLPTKRTGLELLTRDLVHVSVASILSELMEEDVFVQIPQFELGYNNDLVEILKRVQISELFSPRANLSKLFSNRFQSVSVNHIYHSAKITVNEEGSEAAAASGAMFVPLIGSTTTSFVAHHPFVFFVIGTAKNSILFAGKVVSPRTPDCPKKHVAPLINQDTLGQIQINLLTPTSPYKQGSTKINADSTNGMSDETENQNQRNQQMGPKFRSIKPPVPWNFHSGDRKISEGSPIHRVFTSYSDASSEMEPQNSKKRVKTVQEQTKNRKRQEPPTDEWRRHLLIFA